MWVPAFVNTVLAPLKGSTRPFPVLTGLEDKVVQLSLHYLPALYDTRVRRSPVYRRHLRPQFQLAWDYLNGRKPKQHHPYIVFYRLRSHLDDISGKGNEWWEQKLGIRLADRGSSKCGDIRDARTVHFHVGVGVNQCLVSLLAKSDILWWLPRYPQGPPRPDDPHLILSDDPRLPHAYDGDTTSPGPSGPWHGYRIQMLNANALTESVLYLIARDSDGPCPAPDVQPPPWFDSWKLMSFELDDSNRPDTPAYRRRIRPEFQFAWDYLCGRGPPGHCV
ncbi:uncharacterized protein DSM5745_06770 [Aspergillus mulundensis]|uniref:Uncharacterized protein n=1 Tax=Aspergillus mulundensis TaxID=1810919 RepID=A0A3D8RS41_9EURO|nr:hypothetical protein DSM5745_06770 [Aspergillus mulundensis]RDW76778.1 hypothetical protein DSM5745_06770 [Aspergillus mulundensis]